LPKVTTFICKEKRGVLAKYAKHVKSASEGAITDGD
jgi:dihydroxyacid dehydratase/phosphogluconate dehydratase